MGVACKEVPGAVEELISDITEDTKNNKNQYARALYKTDFMKIVKLILKSKRQ